MEKPRATTSAPLRAVLFDAYGTLFDVYSVALLAEQLFPGFGERLSVLWRAGLPKTFTPATPAEASP